ncbi:phosphatidylserine decarboxylase [Alphaproteobacteria bacterium LSUCC0744]
MISGSDWKIADDGWPVLAMAGIVTIVTSLISLPIGCFALGLMVWLAHGLRVPNRQTAADEQSIYAPADGLILDITTTNFPDGMMSDTAGAAGAAGAARCITIQTRLSDLQLQTSPITGHIVENVLLPGLFTSWGDNPASWQAARQVNERREIYIRDSFNRDIVLVQRGSKTARQLVCRLAEGKLVQAGSPIGMARIAGVVDLYVPADCKITIKRGQHVIAGETVVTQFARRPASKQG